MDFSETIAACDLKVGRCRQLIIIISIFKEDNVFSMIASLPYGPPVNTDIVYYQTFFGFFFCTCCNVSCAIFVRRREASAGLKILSTKQGSHW